VPELLTSEETAPRRRRLLAFAVLLLTGCLCAAVLLSRGDASSPAPAPVTPSKTAGLVRPSPATTDDCGAVVEICRPWLTPPPTGFDDRIFSPTATPPGRR
jgi:hypothetical protein